jgi:chromosomal replication initiator protein
MAMTVLTPQEAAWVATAIKLPPSSNQKIREIQLAVCALYNVHHADMLAPTRGPRNVVRARDIALHLAKIATGKSLTALARRFGDRHHTTVLESFKRMEAMIAADPAFATEIAALQTKIGTWHDHGATQ